MINSHVENIDCMEGMKRYPDKHFELAIVDPPYGINIDKKWDSEPPKQEYFDELFRVSENQIIWGGNNFVLPITKSWLCWDKTFSEAIRGKKMSKKSLGIEKIHEFELLWTSFKITPSFIRYTNLGNLTGYNDNLNVNYYQEKKIHRTQKPIELYKLILSNYAKQGDKILDTHGGSMSSVIACLDLGFEISCFELDTDYFNSAQKRIETHLAQSNLFTEKPNIEFINKLEKGVLNGIY